MRSGDSITSVTRFALQTCEGAVLPDSSPAVRLRKPRRDRTQRLDQRPCRGSPGPVETPLYNKLGIPDAYREQANKDVAASIPLGGFGTPEEIAKAVLYLASDESKWTVGSEIIVDGGRTLNG